MMTFLVIATVVTFVGLGLISFFGLMFLIAMFSSIASWDEE